MLVIGVSCQKKNDLETEKAKIIRILKNDSEAHLDRDFKRLAEGWLHTEDVVFIASGRYNYIYHKGWNNYSEYLLKLYKNPLPLKGSFVQKNLEFKIHSDFAWVTYEDYLYDNEEFIQKVIANRVLEKINGEWKIVFTSLVHLTSYGEELSNSE